MKEYWDDILHEVQLVVDSEQLRQLVSQAVHTLLMFTILEGHVKEQLLLYRTYCDAH